MVRSRRCGTKHITGVLGCSRRTGRSIADELGHCIFSHSWQPVAELFGRSAVSVARLMWRGELQFSCTVGEASVLRPGCGPRVHHESEGDRWPRCMLLSFSWCCCERGILQGSSLSCLVLAPANCVGRGRGQHRRCLPKDSYLVDPASSHMLVSKTKPCMSKYERFYTVKLRMAH